MKLFTDCSGSCDDCISHYYGNCIAGHGDDLFSPITEDFVKENIRELKYLDELIEKFPELKELIEKEKERREKMVWTVEDLPEKDIRQEELERKLRVFGDTLQQSGYIEKYNIEWYSDYAKIKFLMNAYTEGKEISAARGFIAKDSDLPIECHLNNYLRESYLEVKQSKMRTQQEIKDKIAELKNRYLKAKMRTYDAITLPEKIASLEWVIGKQKDI